MGTEATGDQTGDGRPPRYRMMAIMMAETPLDRDEFAAILAAHARFLIAGGGGTWNTLVTSEPLDEGIVFGLYVRPDGAIGGQEGQAKLGSKRLDGLDLRGVQLSYADLCGVSCRDQDLTGASLEGSLLVDADFRGSRLNGVNLADADLSRADLMGCDLREADLTNADLENADLSGADLRGALLAGARFPGALLAGARGLPAEVA